MSPTDLTAHSADKPARTALDPAPPWFTTDPDGA